MPIVDIAHQPLDAVSGRPEGFAVTPGKDEVDHGSDTPDFRLHPTMAGTDTPDVGGVDTVLGAAFRQGNLIGSSVARQDQGVGYGPIEPGFNPWDAIKGTKYEPHWDKFTDIRSSAAADARKRQLDMEDGDRRTLAGAPWYKSFPAQLLAGAADIPSLLPGGAFVRGVGGGISVARSAAVTGLAAGAGVGLQEVGLHGTQQLRTLGESAENIGASVFLGGLLGAAGAKLLSHAEWNGAVEALNRDLDRAAPEITGFHGSAHDFDKFDLSNFGAGEGGGELHGFYLTQSEDLASGYRGAGAVRAEPTSLSLARSWFKREGNREAAIKELEAYGDDPVYKGAVDLLRDPKWNPEGNLYRVRLLANEGKLLDLNAPLERQPAGQLIQRQFPEISGNGMDAYSELANRLGGREKASAALREMGIPGARYVGEGGDRNFVAFHHDIMDITHKNGEPVEAQGATVPASVGAAAVEPVSIEGNTIAGRAAGAMATATRPLNPLLRIMQSPSAAVRDIGSKLFENSLYLKKNFEGVASEPAVETLMKEWNGGLVKALQSTEGAWRDYRKGGGQLGKADFREAVGRAMRRGDESDIPEVAAVAKAWRSQVFDPLKEAAIKAGLLPEDVSVDTATSYFSRMWNRNRLIGQEGRFKSIVTDYYSDVIGREYEKATVGFNARMAKLEQEIEDLNLPADERARRLGDLEQSLTEHDIRGGDLTTQADRLSELAGELRKAKDAGDTAALGAAKAEAKTIRETGGEKLKAFTAERSNLRSRRRNVDLGAAGLAERSQQIHETLADLEEANQRSLGRLVTKGQKLERELDKLDPDEAAERISGMRQAFADLASRSDAAADRADKALTAIREGAEQRAARVDTREEGAKAKGTPGGVSLVPFLAKRGGISKDDPLAADVLSIFGKNPVVPGHGRLIRKGGRKLDEAREAAVEAGYLIDEGRESGGVSTSTIRHLLEALDDENRGNKRYQPGEEPLPGIDLDEQAARMEEAGFEPKLGRSEKGGAILDAAEAKISDRLEKHIEQQRARADRMETIAARLDIAEGFDRDGAVAELRAGVQKAIAETSDTALGRGERAQRLQERLAALDPERVKERVKTIHAMQKDLERAYYDRWEIKNLGKGVDPAAKDRPDFTDQAREIADTVYNTLTGRTEAGVRPEFMTVGTRGPMKDRTFNIPDKLVEDFLEHDVDHVGRRYTRVMGADVEMAHKFGSVDMKDQLADIRANYDRMRAGVTDENKLLQLGKAERSDIDDITAMRDLMRGTRAQSPLERNYATITRVAGYINYVRQMGEVVLASLTDAVRPAMVHGLSQYMQTAGHLATNLGAVKMSVEEAKLAGNVAERVLAHRMATLTDIADPYASRGPVEAFMENMSNVASKWNGIRLWTDMMKSVAAVMTQNRILQGVEKFATSKDKPYLAYLGIDESMAERIQAQFAAHGENVDGVRVANTEKWTDEIARRTYRAATNKDMDSVIVQASKADVPLFVHTPTGKALLQFQSFNLASHQRVMMRGLQESPARFVGGTIAMTAMGMFMTWAKAVTGNRLEKFEDIGSNPGWWIGEGLDRSGIIPVPMELANRMEKITGLNPIKGAMKLFDKGSAESQKNQNRNDFGSMLGPTFGLGQDIATVAGIPKTLYAGKDVAQAQKNAGERLMPFNSYYGLRQAIRYVVNPPH